MSNVNELSVEETGKTPCRKEKNEKRRRNS